MSADTALRPTDRYVFGGAAEPLARVAPGQTITLHTDDCFGGLVRSEHDLPSQVCDLSRVNPVTGPVWVDGAEPGDTLALHFVKITPSSPIAVSATFPHFGALTSSHGTPTLQPPLPEQVWVYHLDADRQTMRWSVQGRTLRLPVDAMHGTVGVAPPGGQVLSTLTCGQHGGNLDVPQIRQGVTVYLGVNVPGAMFAIGDGHARQGDGEASGVAVECAMTTTVAVDLIKGETTAWPRLESDDYLYSIGAARPLEDAYRIAFCDMVAWLQQLTELPQLEAYQWLSQAGTARVGNVCDPNYTMAARVAKALLPHGPWPAYGGVHTRLRRLHAS